MTKFRLNRNITDYAKVQTFISYFIRNKDIQLKKNLEHKKYLDVGCGPNAHDNFVNLEYAWTPKIDICWDITTKKYPLEDNRFEGIFTEH